MTSAKMGLERHVWLIDEDLLGGLQCEADLWQAGKQGGYAGEMFKQKSFSSKEV